MPLETYDDFFMALEMYVDFLMSLEMYVGIMNVIRNVCWYYDCQ